MDLTKTVIPAICLALLMCGILAAPVKNEEKDDCPKLSKDALKLIEIITTEGK